MSERPLPPNPDNGGSQRTSPQPASRTGQIPPAPPPIPGSLPGRPPVPPPGQGHVRSHPASERRRKSASRRSSLGSGLYLPWWSILLMLGTVAVVAISIVGLVFLLGGNIPPDSDPRIIIVTAMPTQPDTYTLEPGAPTPTSPLLPAQGVAPGALPTFALEGPTLPPVILSPTPRTINIDSIISITDTDVRLRDVAGLNSNVLAFLQRGERFRIIGGPQRADNLTWWQVVAISDPSRTGWVASNFLQLED